MMTRNRFQFWVWASVVGLLFSVSVQARTTTNTYYDAADFGGDTTDPRIGLLKSLDGPRTDVSDVTTFDYDTAGNLIQTTNALGQVTQITAHNAHGQPLTVVDPNATTTTLTYDARRRLTSRTVGGQTTTFAYDYVGNLITTTLPNGTTLTHTYDAAYRLTAVEDNLGNRIEDTLDDLGNRVQEDVKDPQGTLTRTMSRTYSTLNRLVETLGGAGQSVTYGYDDNGNRTAMTVDPSGLNQQTLQAFDALNRLSSTTDAVNGLTTYTYDARDNLTSVTDPEGLTTTYTYDALDDLIQQQSPDTGTTTYTYDAAGNRLTQTDARGVTVTYSYDALNRLVTQTYPDVNGQPNPENVTYTYDTCTNGVGRLCRMSDESGTTDYAYDARGNRASQTTTRDGLVHTTGYAYNGADQLTQITYPSGRTVDYTRNALGQIDAVSTTFGTGTDVLMSAAGYRPFGPMDALTYGNGLAHSRSYDTDYRLTQLSTGAVLDLGYHYDAANNITAWLNNLDTSRDQTFSYDTLNRLTDAAGVYGTRSYSYDGVGNRLTRTEDSTLETYTYDTASHHLLETANGALTTYTYDAAGNTVNNTDHDFVYGANNRLKEAQILGAPLATHTYNARGERVEKVAAETTHYYYDQNGLLMAEHDGSGEAIREYVYVDGQPLTLIAAGSGGANPDPDEQILDNTDATVTFTGDWPVSTAAAGFEGANYQTHAANGPSPDGTMIDNSDTAFSVTGIWENSTAVAGFEGTDYQHHFASGPSPDGIVIDNSDTTFSVTGTWENSTAVSGFEGTDYQHHFANGPSPDAMVVDNEDPGFSTVGTWNTSTATPGFLGSHYQPNDAGTGSEVATWTFDVPAAGDYDVVARWTSHSNRASNAKYTINHSGGSTVVTVDQQQNGGQDNLLGTFTFEAGTATVTLNDDANGYVIADAVQLVPPGAQPNTATWGFTATATGSFEVYARWTTHTNRATNARYTVTHDGGSATVTVNQQTNGGQYNLLGTFSFTQGNTYSVSLTDEADGFVIADAVQITPPGAEPNTATWTLDIPTTGDYDVFARWTSHPNRATDATYTIHHANGETEVTVNQQQNGGTYQQLGTFTFNQGASHKVTLTDEADGFVIADAIQITPPGAGPNTAAWNPGLTQEAEYEVFAKWTSHPNRATNATYTIHHSGGSTPVAVNQQANGGTFNSLGLFTLDANSIIQLTDVADGYVIADAVKLVRTGTPPASTQAGIFYFYTDHLGTPQIITDDNQNVVWEASYTPFGEATILTETITNNLRAAGQYFDAETGLHYNYFRYYDPSTGRYITSDPIGLNGGLNTYAYVGGNPLMFIDPFGLAGCYVGYPGYPITIPGTSTKIPLTHAGVLSYDAQGRTRYYEYGRYGDDFGKVQRQTVPDLEMGPDGKPTPESWAKLIEALNKIGHGTEAETSCDAKADADKINDFAGQRMNDPNRAPYSWNPFNFNTCTTFANDAMGAGLK